MSNAILPQSVLDDLGHLVVELQRLGLGVKEAQYDAKNFGNYYIDFDGWNRNLRLVCDRGQYVIDADKARLEALGLFRVLRTG